VIARAAGRGEFDATERKALLALARAAIEAASSGRTAPVLSCEGHLAEPRAVFVTLRRRRGGELRGCIGMVGAERPIAHAVRDMAVAAAREDPRFSPVDAAELASLSVEISVLTRPVPIQAAEVEVGRHGLVIELRGRRGLFLPQVPLEQGWTLETYLDKLCRKAGLADGEWRQPDAVLLGFEAEAFSEEDACV
jgi:AmmeMemoRadiSam system protein A